MKRLITILLSVVLAAGFINPAALGAADKLDIAITDTAAYVQKSVPDPQVGSMGGEWAVIGLARSGCSVSDSYYKTYYAAVEKYVRDCNGLLHDKKYTEYSRVILGLTAAGYDPRSVAGYDLTKPLGDFDKTVWQGINGPIWALIALDSKGYANPRRDEYIEEILRRQLPDGGWDMAGKSADPDMTGMALQALARYESQEKVREAIDKALTIQFSYKSSEGAAQMLVAYATLGLNTDALVSELLKYANSDGSFRHMFTGGGEEQMSTEQVLYALVAAQRARDGKASLYDMSDVGDAARKTPAPTPTADSNEVRAKIAEILYRMFDKSKL